MSETIYTLEDLQCIRGKECERLRDGKKSKVTQNSMDYRVKLAVHDEEYSHEAYMCYQCKDFLPPRCCMSCNRYIINTWYHENNLVLCFVCLPDKTKANDIELRKIDVQTYPPNSKTFFPKYPPYIRWMSPLEWYNALNDVPCYWGGPR